MGLYIWGLLASIFFISVNAQIQDYIPHSYHEKPLSSSPSPVPTQAEIPDVIGNKEVVLFLTPDQVKVLQGAGATVRPYPESEPGFEELLKQYQQSLQHQKEQQKKQRYQTASQNQSPKLNSKLQNYYKLLNIQQINDDLAQPRTTERTTTEITTTPQYKIATSQQNYKEKQHLARNPPKNVSQIKFSSVNTNSDAGYLPNYEMVPYDMLPLHPYRFDKVQANIYNQKNDQPERNNQAKHRASQKVNIQIDKESQRNFYTTVNQNPQSKAYKEAQQSVSSNENQHTVFIRPSNHFQQIKYTLMKKEDDKHVYNKAVDEEQRKTYKQFIKSSQRNKQTQVQRNGYMKTINEHYQHAYNNHEKSFPKVIDEAQRSLKTIQATQQFGYSSQTPERVQQNAYTPENENDQRNGFKPAKLIIEEEFETPQLIVEIPRPKLKQNPTQLRGEDKIELKESYRYIDGLQSPVKQMKNQEIPVSPSPTVQTPIVDRDKTSVLLAPLYQHQAITDVISRQREELLNSKLNIQTRLQQIKQAPQQDHQVLSMELENLTRNLGRQNSLAELQVTISKAPSVIINQETEKNRPNDYVKQQLPILSTSQFVRVKGPVEVKIPASYPAPVKFIRPTPVPVLIKNDEEKKAILTLNRNVYDFNIQKGIPAAIKLPFNPVAFPEHFTIIRPIWEH